MFTKQLYVSFVFDYKIDVSQRIVNQVCSCTISLFNHIKSIFVHALWKSLAMNQKKLWTSWATKGNPDDDDDDDNKNNSDYNNRDYILLKHFCKLLQQFYQLLYMGSGICLPFFLFCWKH